MNSGLLGLPPGCAGCAHGTGARPLRPARSPPEAPLIGLPIGHALDGSQAYRMPTSYAAAIERAGGVPVVVPLVEHGTLASLFDLIDGLLLAGGGDIGPAEYGAVDRGKLTGVDADRDRVELFLARLALRHGKPVLGICRGIQTLNVAAGGTLVQDLPTERASPVTHRTPSSAPPSTLAHVVTVTPRSLLAESLGLEPGRDAHDIEVNSTHHQAVERIADGFIVSARAPDGVVEAIEMPRTDARFVLGVQWHPERLVADFAAMSRLFGRFVAMSLAWAHERNRRMDLSAVPSLSA